MTRLDKEQHLEVEPCRARDSALSLAVPPAVIGSVIIRLSVKLTQDLLIELVVELRGLCGLLEVSILVPTGARDL